MNALFVLKLFLQNMLLKEHIRFHKKELPSRCIKCHALLRSLTSVRYHQIKHSGDKPFTCKICKAKFISIEDLERHIRFHSGEKDNFDESFIIENQDKKRVYECFFFL